MASYTGIDTFTAPAGANLSADTNQFKFVKLTTAGAVVVCSVAGEAAVGVLLEGAVSGGTCVVATFTNPVMKVRAGATLNAGVGISTAADADAEAVGAGDVQLGILLEAGASGKICRFTPVQLQG